MQHNLLLPLHTTTQPTKTLPIVNQLTTVPQHVSKTPSQKADTTPIARKTHSNENDCRGQTITDHVTPIFNPQQKKGIISL